MARHRGSRLIPEVVRHRLVVGSVAMGAVGMLVQAWVARQGDPDGALLWLGAGIFTASAAVMAGSLSIGPRPLRSFGVGCWLLAMAGGAFMAWRSRHAIEGTRPRDLIVPPLMLLFAVGLVPLGLWLMIWRPEQNWEKEMRVERQRDDHNE
jgi:hypothetical protein